MKDYFTLAYKNLRRRGIRSWLTLLGVVIGIAAVISLISLGNSLKDTVNAQFDVSSTEIITVQAGGLTNYGPPGTGVTKPLTVQDSDAIEKLSSVDVTIPRDIKTMKVLYNDKLSYTFAASMPDNYKIKYVYEAVGVDVTSGRKMEEGDKGVVLIGNNLASKDKNPFGKDINVGNKININGKDFRVLGILKKKGSFIIDNAILMNEKDLKEVYPGIGDNVDIIAVKVKSKDLVDKAKEDIEKLMRDRRDVKKGQEDFSVSTPQAALQTVNQIITGIQIFVIIIASISILVGAIGISNTMATSVLERRRDIGIMKSVGARNENIFYQFFIEAGLLGFIGGLIGIALGLSVGYLGNYAIGTFIGNNTTLNVNFILMGFVLLGSFLIGAVSGIVPAINAAKQNPVDAMRK